MIIVAVLNQKGGVGKTTLAVNVGVGLARLGRRVALADLDPQAHLTRSLGLEPGGVGVYDLLKGQATLEDVMFASEGLELVPGSPELAGADTEFAATPGKERLAAKALDGLKTRAEVLLLDCPPNLGLVTVNALALARWALIPVQAEYLALASLGSLMDTVEAARAFNPDLGVLGMVLTRYNHRKRLCREVAQTARAHFPEHLLETRIRESVALAEAPGFGQSVFAYAPRSAAALDLASLCREIDARLGKGAGR